MSLNSLSYGSISGPTGLTGPYPTLYLNPSVNNLNCVSLTSGSQTITGDETINGNLFVGQNINLQNNSKYLAIASGGEVSVFGTPTGATGSTGPFGYYGLSTVTNYTAIVNQGLGTKIFEGSVNTNVGLQINNNGSVTTQNNTLDDGSGNSTLQSVSFATSGGVPASLNYYEIFQFTSSYFFQGGLSTSSLTFSLIRLGSVVTLSTPSANLSGVNASGLLVSQTDLPTTYRPASTKIMVVSGTDNAVNTSITMSILSNGLIRFAPISSTGLFLGGGLSGPSGGCTACYSLLSN